MSIDELMDLLDEWIEYFHEEAQEYLKDCLALQDKCEEGDFEYQCYLVNSGREDGLKAFKSLLEDKLSGEYDMDMRGFYEQA